MRLGRDLTSITFESKKESSVVLSEISMVSGFLKGLKKVSHQSDTVSEEELISDQFLDFLSLIDSYEELQSRLGKPYEQELESLLEKRILTESTYDQARDEED